MKRICVFCGSSSGITSNYTQAAKALGQAILNNNLSLVYGGGSVGLMGEIANTVLQGKGEVIGVAPQFMVNKGVLHPKLSQLKIVDTMHHRKALMAELADAFIVLPGGFGTLEEFFEIITWGQLELHQKPCGLLNVNQFYQPLIQFLDHLVTQGFIKDIHRAMILCDKDPQKLIEQFYTYQAPQGGKWIPKN